MVNIEEVSIFQRFQSNYPGFPLGKIIHPDKPDFIIQGDDVIGIEITQVFKNQDSLTGSLVRTKENFKRGVLQIVVNLLNATNFPKCVLSIEFNDHLFTKKHNSRTIATKCYDQMISKASIFDKPGTYEIENLGELPEIIESYCLLVDSDIMTSDYIETSGATLPQLTNSHIQYILDKKEIAKDKYRRCDSYWLVIKEGSFEADSFSEIQIDKSALRTTFDKVFIIRQANSEIIELK